MGNMSPLAPRWVANRSVMHERKIEQFLQRFHRRYRLQVTAAARQHPAIADLAVSFPALLFVLAVPHKGVDTAKLLPLVRAGAPMKAIAKQASLPMWTRRLPPEAFGQPLTHLPRQHCSQQITNFVPNRRRLTDQWLRNVINASEDGDEAFALWVAREWGSERTYCNAMRKMALWAWFSTRPELDTYQFVTRPWRPQMKRKAARAAMRECLARFKLHVTIADAALSPLWIDSTEQSGFDFVPLLSAKEIHEEAHVMENCIRAYGMDLALNQQRLWSVRQNGKRLATLSIGSDYDLELLTITEIKGPKNEKVPRDVAVVAWHWFHKVDVTAIHVKPTDWDKYIPNPKVWAALLKPYWLEKKRIPQWLPLAPTLSQLECL